MRHGEVSQGRGKSGPTDPRSPPSSAPRAPAERARQCQGSSPSTLAPEAWSGTPGPRTARMCIRVESGLGREHDASSREMVWEGTHHALPLPAHRTKVPHALFLPFSRRMPVLKSCTPCKFFPPPPSILTWTIRTWSTASMARMEQNSLALPRPSHTLDEFSVIRLLSWLKSCTGQQGGGEVECTMHVSGPRAREDDVSDLSCLLQGTVKDHGGGQTGSPQLRFT